MCRRSPATWFLLGMLVSAVGIAAWWLQLTEDRQRFYINILKQVPDLPARYLV